MQSVFSVLLLEISPPKKKNAALEKNEISNNNLKHWFIDVLQNGCPEENHKPHRITLVIDNKF